MDPKDSTRDLGEGFRQLFELTPALDEASRDQVYRIRHEVYCRDLGWEPVREDGRETDGFDRHSIHFLLRRRGTGEPVGCTRLILARPENPMHPLPFENSCREVLDRSLADPARMPRHTVGEVSRLAVLSSYRQRRGESTTAVSVTDDDFATHGPHARFPFVPLGLYLGVTAVARRFGIENVFVLTEPRLAAHFERIGFDIRTVGAAIEHRGTRVPSLMHASTALDNLRPLIRPMFVLIDQAVDAAFRAHPGASDWMLRGAA